MAGVATPNPHDDRARRRAVHGVDCDLLVPSHDAIEAVHIVMAELVDCFLPLAGDFAYLGRREPPIPGWKVLRGSTERKRAMSRTGRVRGRGSARLRRGSIPPQWPRVSPVASWACLRVLRVPVLMVKNPPGWKIP